METRKVRIKSVNSRNLRLESEGDIRMLRPMRRMTYVSVVKCPLNDETTILDRCARCERFVRILDYSENVFVECKA